MTARIEYPQPARFKLLPKQAREQALNLALGMVVSCLIYGVREKYSVAQGAVIRQSDFLSRIPNQNPSPLDQGVQKVREVARKAFFIGSEHAQHGDAAAWSDSLDRRFRRTYPGGRKFRIGRDVAVVEFYDFKGGPEIPNHVHPLGLSTGSALATPAEIGEQFDRPAAKPVHGLIVVANDGRRQAGVLENLEVDGFLEGVGVLILVYQNRFQRRKPLAQIAIGKPLKKLLLKQREIIYAGLVRMFAIRFQHPSYQILGLTGLSVTVQVNAILNQPFEQPLRHPQRLSTISRLIAVGGVAA